MSIYAVKASEWWVAHRSDPKEMRDSIILERKMIKAMLKSRQYKCLYCGKIITDKQ